jgi:hypothetical protein
MDDGCEGREGGGEFGGKATSAVGVNMHDEQARDVDDLCMCVRVKRTGERVDHAVGGLGGVAVVPALVLGFIGVGL